MPNVFEQVKELVGMEQAIAFLGLQVKQESPGQWRSVCPACKGSGKRDLSINTDIDKFRCFKSNKGGTDATALVAHVRQVTQKEAAEMLLERYGTRPTSKPRTEQPRDTDHPILDILGLTSADCEALGAGYDPETARFVIPLKVGTLAIATSTDQAPLLLFSINQAEGTEDEEKPSPDELRRLFRVV